MTVCVAVISGEGSTRPTIYGVMDEMLTSDDIEFEPPQAKYTILGSSLAVMFAGHSSLHRQTLDAVRTQLAEPNIRVESAARVYARQHDAERRRILEAVVLNPLGLDWEAWEKNQRRMKDSFVQRVMEDLEDIDGQIDSVATLFVGFDDSGPHIFRTEGRRVTTSDDAGFAAIGTGARHAESYLMGRRYTRGASSSEGMIAAYFAKKRGETAPGVGRATDVFLVWPPDEDLQGGVFDQNHHNRWMDEIYEREQQRAQESEEMARTELDKYFEARVAAARALAETLRRRATPSEPSQEPTQAAPQSLERPTGDSSRPPASQD